MGLAPIARGRRVIARGVTLSVAAAVCALGVANNAGASDAILYVDNTNQLCSDNGAGSATQPFCTIGAAAAQVSAGQTVEVAGTTYPEQVTVAQSGTATAPIVFTAAPGASPTVMGGDDGFYVSGQRDRKSVV